MYKLSLKLGYNIENCVTYIRDVQSKNRNVNTCQKAWRPHDGSMYGGNAEVVRLGHGDLDEISEAL